MILHIVRAIFKPQTRAQENLATNALKVSLSIVLEVGNGGVQIETSACLLASLVMKVLFLYISYNS